VADLKVPDVKLDYHQQEETDEKDYDGLDRFGRIKDQYWVGYGSTSDVDRFHYTHDEAGNRLIRDIDSAIYSTNNKDQLYTYDDQHRLDAYKEGTLSGGDISSPVKQLDWTLDALGNWKELDDDGDQSPEQTRKHNLVNEIADATDVIDVWLDPTYDAAGNMTQGPKPGDEAEADGTEHEYTYDAWNRLVKVRERAYSCGSPGGWSDVAQYKYDGLGRRIWKEDLADTGTPEYDYYYDYGQVVEEHLDQDTTYPLAQYVWHPYYIDAPVMRYFDSNTEGTLDGDENAVIDGVQYYTHDATFNVTSLLKNDGTALERYTYTPYGAVTRYSGTWGTHSTDYENPYLYTGRRLDAEMGLYYYFARYYHAQLGRFINRDPIEYGGGDANLYRYVSNQPTIATDPSGLDRIEAIYNEETDRFDLYYIDEFSWEGSLPFLFLNRLFFSEGEPEYVGTIDNESGFVWLWLYEGETEADRRWTSVQHIKEESDCGGTDWDEFREDSRFTTPKRPDRMELEDVPPGAFASALLARTNVQNKLEGKTTTPDEFDSIIAGVLRRLGVRP